jgi:pyruvate dehydrogenase (quinone)
LGRRRSTSFTRRAGSAASTSPAGGYALSLPSHVPAQTLKGFTLSLAEQALSGKMDEVIETLEHNVRLL